jgi:AraC-like DNA-binding protein
MNDAVALSCCRPAYGEHLNPLGVRLRHTSFACRQDYDSFFRCPILFDADRSDIAFARTDVDRPLPSPNRELARANDLILTDFLATLSRDDLVTRVRIAIAHELPSGKPRDENIAKGVYMSPRTLRRKLAAAGTSFSRLIDEVRHELARRYIADPARTLSEISFLVGFSELSAFSRAFRRWTGKTPSAFRAVC